MPKTTLLSTGRRRPEDGAGFTGQSHFKILGESVWKRARLCHSQASFGHRRLLKRSKRQTSVAKIGLAWLKPGRSCRIFGPRGCPAAPLLQSSFRCVLGQHREPCRCGRAAARHALSKCDGPGHYLVTAFGKRAVPVQLPRMLADICEMIQRSSTNRAPCSF